MHRHRGDTPEINDSDATDEGAATRRATRPNLVGGFTLDLNAPNADRMTKAGSTVHAASPARIAGPLVPGLLGYIRKRPKIRERKTA